MNSNVFFVGANLVFALIRQKPNALANTGDDKHRPYGFATLEVRFHG
jgi:hypothetical protein